MNRSRILLLLVLVAVAALVIWIYQRNAQPPEVPFAKAVRERLVSTLVTNGKVEPYRWTPVRAEAAGLVKSLAVERGQRVAAGALIATLDAADAESAVAAAEAAVSQAKAQLATISAGGTAAARVEIDNGLAKARLDLKNAETEAATLQRLEAKQAATQQQVTEARQRVEQLQSEIVSLERKRAALVDQPDRAAAEARLQEAQATLAQARNRLHTLRITAPMGGIAYEVAARTGAYLQPGDLVASVGELDRVKVRVFVDEPELGRVREGLAVSITWDALPGRKWQGTVETKPTQVVSLGTRQVGEVVCSIENPGLDLLPGTNVNAEIVSQVVENAIAIPKEAVRRGPANEVGVYVLQDGKVRWRAVKLGVSSITRTAVEQGLAEGDQVALSTQVALKDGDAVTAVVR